MKLCLLALAAPSVPAQAGAGPDYHLVSTFPLGGGGGWDYLNFDPGTGRLYVTRGSHVSVVDAAAGTLVGDIPDTPHVHGVALATALGKGFTSNGDGNTVTVFDLATLKERRRIPVGVKPDCIIFDPATDRVFVMDGGSDQATVIDANTETVLATLALGGQPEYAVADGAGHVYVNLTDKNTVAALDSNALRVVSTWSLGPGTGPSGLAMDRAHRRLFSVCDNGKLIVLDADSGRVVATPAIGRGPDAAAFDPAMGLAFSSNGQDGTLSVIRESDPDTFTSTSTVPTQLGARTMVLDPVSHRIYLVTARFGPGATWQQRRHNFVPGSFVLLVVAPGGGAGR